MKFDKSKKRKFDGGGDRGRFKKQRWNKNPGQSGANATPLGERANGAVADSIERLPTSIPQPHRQDDRLGDKSEWTEKKGESKNEHTNSQEKERDAAITTTEKFSTPKEEKAKKRKGKHRNEDNTALDESGMHEGGENPEGLVPDKQDKKRRKTLDPVDKVETKAERRKAAKTTRIELEKNTHDVGQPATTEHNNEQLEKSEDLAGSATSQKKERFICFVGQLPFTCTTEDIQKHFAKVQPDSIRHVTHKDGGKSKGYAFLEFDNWDRMRTCLKLYHHSEFEDGKSKPRKINIELTPGGGGNSDSRREKIGSKNEKLEEERKRDYEKQKQEKNQRGGEDGEERPKLSKYEKSAKKSTDSPVLTKKQKKMKAKQEKKSSRSALSKNKTPKMAVEQTQKGSDYAGMDPSRAALMGQQN